MEIVRIPAQVLIEMRCQLVRAARAEMAGVVMLVPSLAILISMAAGPEPFETARASLWLGGVFGGVVLLRAGRRARKTVEVVIGGVIARAKAG